MKTKTSQANVSTKIVHHRIYIIRGHRVMLSTDLAELYGVEPKVLVQAVKRNSKRFPKDFMYQLKRQEVINLKSQFVTSSWGGIRRALPYAFTEQGVAMLSSVLNSERAIRVNIAIMRAFVKLRERVLIHNVITEKLTQLESKVGRHDKDIQVIFKAIYELMNPRSTDAIGFQVE